MDNNNNNHTNNQAANTNTSTPTNNSNSSNEALTPQQQIIKVVRSHLFLIRKGVVVCDVRLIVRVLRELSATRKKLTFAVIKHAIKQYMPDTQNDILKNWEQLQSRLPADMDINEDLSAPKSVLPPVVSPVTVVESKVDLNDRELKRRAEQLDKEKKEAEMLAAVVPEVDVYIQLLATLFLLDQGLRAESFSLMSDLVFCLQSFNRRSMDPLSAKVYYYYQHIEELQPNSGVEIKNQLLAFHRTECLHHNEDGQVALIVSILRHCVTHHQYAQADAFRLKAHFPEQRSNAQTARYLYYTGKILAVQLHYSDAFTCLSAALRKAPQRAAVGFRQTATKLLVLVQLLMGDIPDRTLFTQKDLERSLKPYLQLTQAVRIGDLSLFNDVMTKHKLIFEADGIYSLIIRLRSNVIKAGLRKINLAYSRISIKDICAKLKLSNVCDGEYMICKAIHDGVIEAVVDRERGYVYSKAINDVCASDEPQQAFHKRIQFTNVLQQQAVKSLRYPGSSGKRKDVLDSDDDEEDEDTISGNAPDKREEETKK